VHSKKIKSKNEKLEAEVEKVRAHAFNLSEKCSKLENRVFSLDKFIPDEDIAFYTGFPWYAAFMATCAYLFRGKAEKTFDIGVLFKMMSTLNIMKENLNLVVDLGRILNSDVQAKAGFS